MFRNNFDCGMFGLSRLWRFLRHSSGASIIEYALILALIIGSVTIALYSMNDSAHDSLVRLVNGLDNGHSSARSFHGDVGQYRSEIGSSLSSIIGQDTMRWVHNCGWYIAIIAFVIILLLVRRMHRKKTSTEPTDDDIILEEIEPQQRRRLFEKRQQIRTILSHDASMLFDSSIGVRHFMSDTLIGINSSRPANEVFELMEREEIRHLLVYDKNNRLEGIISDRDLKSNCGKKASDLMSSPPITVTLDTPIGQAVTTMLHNRISALPVLRDSETVGILTATDIMMSFQCVLQLLVRVSKELHDSNDAGDNDYGGSTVAKQEDRMSADPNAELLETTA